MISTGDIVTERFLEDILVQAPWIIEPNFQILERQKVTKVGILDILGKDASGNFVIVELKRNRASDVVVGQIARYMSIIQEIKKISMNQIRGIIICEKMSKKLEYASRIIPNLKIIQLTKNKPNVEYRDLEMIQEYQQTKMPPVKTLLKVRLWNTLQNMEQIDNVFKNLCITIFDNKEDMNELNSEAKKFEMNSDEIYEAYIFYCRKWGIKIKPKKHFLQILAVYIRQAYGNFIVKKRLKYKDRKKSYSKYEGIMLKRNYKQLLIEKNKK